MIKYLLVFLIISNAVFGQLKGRVEDRLGNAIQSASIFNSTRKIGAISNQKGGFSLDNYSIGDKVIVSYIGYKSKVLSENDFKQMNNLIIKLDEDDSLEEIVVTATLKQIRKSDSPIPISTYSSAYFRTNPYPSIFESIQLINGIRPQLNCNVCNTGDIHINGQEGTNTMVLIDGLPIVSGLATVYGLTGIPQSLIEQIEVVKGPASSLYGSEAIGGVINLITKTTENAPIISLDTFSTSWGEINFDFGGKYQIGKNKGLVGINYFNYSDPIDKNKDGFTDLTLQHRISIFNKISSAKNDLAFRLFYEDRWGGQMNWTPEYRNGTEVYGESIYTERWEFFGKYQINDNWFAQYSLNGHNQNSVYGNLPYNADQKIGFIQAVRSKESEKGKSLFGFSYRLTDFDDTTPATVNRTRTHLPGIFTQLEKYFDNKNTLLGGLRYDYHSINGSVVTPRLNYKWNNDLKTKIFRLSFGTGYRVVNVFTEDHAALTGAREVIFEEQLSPEKSWNITSTWVQKIYSKTGIIISLNGSAFYTRFSNRILPDYETNPNEIRYRNLEEYSTNSGITFNTQALISNALQLQFGLTWIDAQIVQNKIRQRPLLTEKFSGNYSLNYNPPSFPIRFDLTGTIIGPMKLPLLSSLDPREANSPWIHDSNLQFTWKGKNIELYGGIKNIFDFTPDENSIARAFDPFDKNIDVDQSGNVIPTKSNPYALSFDPSYVFYSNQGRRFFVGFRFQKI